MNLFILIYPPSIFNYLFPRFFSFLLKVLEKMRPLDHKLKYQIDKLVRTAVTGSLGKTDVSSSDLTFIFGLEFHERVDLGHMTNIRPSFHVSQASVYKNVFCFC